jgi:hypothetical protein
MSKFLAIFTALSPVLGALSQSAESIFGPGNGAAKFQFVLGAVNFGVTQALPHFTDMLKSHDAASINSFAGDATNLVVAGLNAAGKLGKPAPVLVGSSSTTGGK